MICLTCDGEGKQYCVGIHPSRRRSGVIGDMTSPDEWWEDCEDCNGTGYVDDAYPDEDPRYG